MCVHVLACAAGEELSRRVLDGSSYFKISVHIRLGERFLVLQLLPRTVLAVQWNSSSVNSLVVLVSDLYCLCTLTLFCQYVCFIELKVKY